MVIIMTTVLPTLIGEDSILKSKLEAGCKTPVSGYILNTECSSRDGSDFLFLSFKDLVSQLLIHGLIICQLKGSETLLQTNNRKK